MPRQHQFLVQTQAQPGGRWITVEKLKIVEPAIRLADSLAQAHLPQPPYAAVQVVQGRDVIERIVTRTKVVSA